MSSISELSINFPLHPSSQAAIKQAVEDIHRRLEFKKGELSRTDNHLMVSLGRYALLMERPRDDLDSDHATLMVASDIFKDRLEERFAKFKSMVQLSNLRFKTRRDPNPLARAPMAVILCEPSGNVNELLRATDQEYLAKVAKFSNERGLIDPPLRVPRRMGMIALHLTVDDSLAHKYPESENEIKARLDMLDEKLQGAVNELHVVPPAVINTNSLPGYELTAHSYARDTRLTS